MLHRQIRGALVAIAALCSLAVASSATAASWQGPIRISGPVVNASAGTSIALGVSGDAAAAWSDDGAGGEIVLVRKRAGSAWSSPDVPAGAGNGPVFTGVDGVGNITAAYSAGGVTTLLNWPATATAAVATPLGVPMTVTDLAVDASGDAVIAGLSGSPAGLTVGYRRGRDGEFSLHTYTSAELGSNATSARVAIDESLGAAVLFVSGPKLLAATRTAATDWPATPETVEGTLTVSGDPAVTFDSAGALLAAFTYETATPAKVLRTARRQDGGSWLESGDLTLATPNSSADSLNLEAGPAAEVALVWNQTSAFQLERQGAVRLIHHRRVGPTEDVSSAGTATPVAVIGNDGSVVAVWERLVAGGSLEETSLRSGSGWGAAHQTERVHPNATIPSLATDRRGDFATLATPYNGTGHPVLVSWYDSAPPLLEASPVGDMFAGRPITFTAFVVDAWSTAGTPEWVFGDGATGSGLTVTHTYVAPGTYAGHMTVTDAAGNTATADTGVVVRPAAWVRLGNARFVAKWKQSRVSGTLHVTCTAPIGGTYVVNVMRGTALKLHVSPHLSRDGTVTRAIRLPATLVPGTYRVALLSTFKAVRSASLEARLAAPAEGVADSASLSRTRAGKAARALTAATALWARFHLAAVPGARSSS